MPSHGPEMRQVVPADSGTQQEPPAQPPGSGPERREPRAILPVAPAPPRALSGALWGLLSPTERPSRWPSDTTSSSLGAMVEDDRKSALVIRAGGRTIHPSPDDTGEIQEGVAAITEIFQSLLRTAAADQTIAALLSASNGEAYGVTHGDLQEVTQRLHDVLSALPGAELNVDNLGALQFDLDRHAETMRQSFEARSEQFTPALGVIGALFAGLSDAAGALDQLVHLLKEIVQKSGEGGGSP